MDRQFAIKLILIAVFAVFAVFLMLPSRSVRHIAIRRLVMVAVLGVTILAVVNPDAINAVAHAVGVGRGTDLLLYGLIVVFIGNSLVQQRRSRHIEQQLTQMARRMAIAEAQLPAAAGGEILPRSAAEHGTESASPPGDTQD